MWLWTATCHIQVETQRQRDLELVDESSCLLQQSKQMPTLFQSSEKRFNQMRNWEVGSGCHKRFYRHLLFDLYILYLLKLPAPPRAALLVYLKYLNKYLYI